jgi:hypothetical protein
MITATHLKPSKSPFWLLGDFYHVMEHLTEANGLRRLRSFLETMIDPVSTDCWARDCAMESSIAARQSVIRCSRLIGRRKPIDPWA